MRLLGVPRTPAGCAQPSGELHEARHLDRGGARLFVAGVDVEGCEVIGVKAAVELDERSHLDVLVAEAEALQNGDGSIGVEVFEQRQLDVRQQQRLVALRDQHRAHEVDVVDRARVDDTCARGHGVDADAGPREVGEREAGDDFDVGGRAQQRNGALGDRGVPGDGIHDATAGGVRRDEPVDHRAVRGLEVGRGFVHVVERREVEPLGFEVGDRGMAGGAHEAEIGCGECTPRRRQQVVGTRRTESDDRDHWFCAEGSTETKRRQPVAGQMPTRRSFHEP